MTLFLSDQIHRYNGLPRGTHAPALPGTAAAAHEERGPSAPALRGRRDRPGTGGPDRFVWSRRCRRGAVWLGNAAGQVPGRGRIEGPPAPRPGPRGELDFSGPRPPWAVVSAF